MDSLKGKSCEKPWFIDVYCLTMEYRGFPAEKFWE
jgi:hypothetical protein